MTRLIPAKEKTYTKTELLRLAYELSILYLRKYDLPQYSGLLESIANKAVNLRLHASEMYDAIKTYDTIPASIADFALNDAEIALNNKCQELTKGKIEVAVYDYVIPQDDMER